MMALGCDGVFVGSGIFKSSDPPAYARAIVEATTFWEDAARVAKVSRGLGEAMTGIELEKLADGERLAIRGW
jgi:pyridoxal 5'-phosphate synthase pdxS subunit